METLVPADWYGASSEATDSQERQRPPAPAPSSHTDPASLSALVDGKQRHLSDGVIVVLHCGLCWVS